MNAILENAAQGVLPDWAEVKPKRRAHIERVATLVGEWANALELNGDERKRWLAAAWLHDALRDAKPESLRSLVPDDLADWPGPLLHGPAAAARLRTEGVNDEALLRAVAYHTIGHPEFDGAGRAVYLADFLEPGRTFDPVGRAVLRARMPHDENAVLRQVLRSRMAHLISSHKKIRRETVAFWNSTAG
jgi:2-amino-4-hydroxy-6-hydroxymethyldihydropteridine diphosphokinase